MESTQNIEKQYVLKSYILLIVATLIWGGSWPLGRWLVSEELGGETIPPLMIAIVRYFIVIWTFFLLLRWREGTINFSIVTKHWRPLFLMGLTSVTIYQIGFLYGESYTAASDASLIVATNPIWVFILSGLFLGEGFGRKKAAGVLLAFLGVLLVVGFSPNENVPDRFLGDLFILFAALGYSVYTIIYRNYMNGFDAPSDTPSSLFVITWVSFFGFLITTPISLFINPEYLDPLQYLQIPNRIWLGVAYLSILSTVGAYWFYLEAVKRLNASRAAIFINLVPVWGVSFSVLFIGEFLDPVVHISAFLLISSGIYLANRS
ncbi:hypothetical protein CEE45_02010 [Candidatus Heimdallarchaeota archaeon B3_Heim]|nr:MAG: hypothetical protein CEE45_02010 [Candidatus Heimdallarchaeota archaeon B3_Heim]